MKLTHIALISMILGVCSCGQGQAPSSEPVSGGNDLVASIMSGEESLDLNKFTWINAPKQYQISGNSLVFETSEKTDLWQHTLNGADLANAPMLVASAKGNFSFVVKTDFSDAKTEYDQCGPIVYMDRDNWLKASVEKSSGEGLLGSVNNIDGHSDWATSAIPEDVKTVWYKVNRTGCDVVIQSSFDGVKYNILRFTHINNAEDEVKVGLYACSPGDGASFKAVFSDIEFLKSSRPF